MASDSRTILVLTNDAGLGHRQAAMATVAALEQRYGALCSAILVNPLEEPQVPGWLRNVQYDYNHVVRAAPALYAIGHRVANSNLSTRIVERFAARALALALGQILERARPDIVVTTHPVLIYPLIALRQYNRASWPIVVLATDLTRLQRLWFRPEVDLYLVPTADAAELATRRGVAPERVHVTGIPVDLGLDAQRLSQAELRARYGWNPDQTTVFAVGSRRVHQFLSFLHAVNESGLAFQLVVVTGDDEELLSEVQAVDWRLPVFIYGFVDDFPTRLQAADLIVTKAGGLTVAESLAAGRPLMIIQCTPMHEKGNARYIVENRAGLQLESPAALVEGLRRMLAGNGRLLREMTANAKALGRPRAAFEAAELIWAEIERHEDSPAPVGEQGMPRS